MNFIPDSRFSTSINMALSALPHRAIDSNQLVGGIMHYYRRCALVSLILISRACMCARSSAALIFLPMPNTVAAPHFLPCTFILAQGRLIHTRISLFRQ